MKKHLQWMTHMATLANTASSGSFFVPPVVVAVEHTFFNTQPEKVGRIACVFSLYPSGGGGRLVMCFRATAEAARCICHRSA